MPWSPSRKRGEGEGGGEGGGGGRGEGEQAPGDSEGLRTSNPQDSTWTQPLCEISSGPRLSATVYNLHLPLNSLPFVRVLVPFLTPVHANAYVYAYVRRYVHVILRTIPGIAAQLYAVAAYTRGPRPLPPTPPPPLHVCTKRVKLAKSFVLFFVSMSAYARTPSAGNTRRNGPLPSVYYEWYIW